MRPTLIEIVEKELKRRGWSMAEMDRQAGFSVGETSRFLAGKRDFHWSKVEKLLDALGLKISKR
jgi:lambda repressor-like predicted transcriptional regulator